MSLLTIFLILVASFPTGYLIKYLTKEEMESGKKYFQWVWTIAFILAIFLLFIPFNDFQYKQSIIFSLLFIANVAFISWKA